VFELDEAAMAQAWASACALMLADGEKPDVVLKEASEMLAKLQEQVQTSPEG